MMAQHAQLLATISLILFGTVGILTALLWRKLAFRVVPLALALGVVIWITGLLLVYLQIHALQAAVRIEKWPSTEGTVLRSSIIGERAFRPNIVYEYSVAGAKYIDSTDLDQPGFGGRNNKRNAAETIIAQYPAGTKVAVHYDPADPTQAVLRTSPDWSDFGKIGLGGFLFGAGLFLAIRYFIARRQSRPSA